MVRFKKREEIKVSPEMAQDFLDINTFKLQRGINKKHLRELEKAIKEKQFITPRIVIAQKRYNKIKNGYKEILIDGQHISTAIKNTKETINCIIEKYEVHDKKELSEIYRLCNNERSKTLQTCVLIEQESLGIEWDRAIAPLVVGACAEMIDPNRFKLTKNDKVQLLKDNIEVGDFVNKIFFTSNPEKDNVKKAVRHLWRSGVVMAMIKTYHKNKKQSVRFWSDVRDGVGLDRKNPALVLRDYLKTATVHYGMGAKKAVDFNIKPVTRKEMHVKCILAWNAYRKGTTTDLKYYHNKPVPKEI